MLPQLSSFLQVLLTFVIRFFFFNPHHILGVGVYFHNSAMVVMLIHKVAEPFLFLGKTAVNLKWDSASTFIFVLFILVWVPSRLFFFPAWSYNGISI